MSDSKFIESVEFKKGAEGEENLFLPFKGGDKVFFGGEAEMQKLIEFYLKDKKIYKSDEKTLLSAKENSERFKINCVLGNNGGGKSRFFEGFLAYDTDFHTREYNKGFREDFYIVEGNEEYNGETILDDFFVLSNSYTVSVNYDFLSPAASRTQSIINSFIFETYNFLSRHNEIKKVFSTFLNLERNYNIELFSNIYERNNNLLDKGFIKKIKNNEISKIPIDSNGTIYLYKFLCSVFLSEYKESFPNIFSQNSLFIEIINNEKEVFKLLYILLFTKSGKLKNRNLGIDIQEFNDNCERLFSINGTDFINIKEKKITKEDYNSLDIFDRFDYKKYENTGKVFDFGKEITKEEQYILTYILSGDDIKFGNKFYGSLSGGEKVMLTRFSNIYKNIVSCNKEHEKKLEKNVALTETCNVTILIDEPDLHLHLDWQKKYIQKLIDVFSTLPENINVHFIIATHSPFIISDLPAECIVKLEGKGKNEDGTHNKNGTGKYTRITNYDGVEHKGFIDFKEFNKHEFKKKTFGANFVDIINDGFFFDDKVLMGGFAESVIGDVAEEDRTFALLSVYDFKKDKDLINKLLKKIKKVDVNSEKEFIECIKDYQEKKNKKLDIKNDEISVEKQIGDEYLKDNLLYFVSKNKDD